MDAFMAAARDEEFAVLMETAVGRDLEDGKFKGMTDEGQRLKALGMLRERMGEEGEHAMAIGGVKEQVGEGAVVQPVAVVKRMGMRRRVWWWVAAAVVILAVVVAGDYFTSGRSMVDYDIMHNEIVAAPQRTRAVLTLADGRKVALDSIGGKGLVKQGHTEILKTADGQVAYKGRCSELMYNSITNPRGSKVVTLTLSDGTKVWLNNETTIKYPVNFPADQRLVEVTGEAYFEVSSDPKRKFLVKSREFTTEVLGTHFNVNSYVDGDGSLVALLEGKVRVMGSDTARAVLLQPGQGAVIRSGSVEKTSTIDPDGVMAWKEGRFYFMSATLRTVMNELSRWYDLDVEYDVKVGKHFTGVISRTVTAQEVFAMLEQTSDLRFLVDGKRVIITKKERL